MSTFTLYCYVKKVTIFFRISNLSSIKPKLDLGRAEISAPRAVPPSMLTIVLEAECMTNSTMQGVWKCLNNCKFQVNSRITEVVGDLSERDRKREAEQREQAIR